MNTYRPESSNPKWNAQRNLSGRSHYVDDDTLRFHKSRILKTAIVDQGLLFCLIESCALDMHNTRRGFRYVIFDVFGNTVSRPDLEITFNTSAAAEKAMWAEVNKIDAKALTMKAIDSAEKYTIAEYEQMRETVRQVRDLCDSKAA